MSEIKIELIQSLVSNFIDDLEENSLLISREKLKSCLLSNENLDEEYMMMFKHIEDKITTAVIEALIKPLEYREGE